MKNISLFIEKKLKNPQIYKVVSFTLLAMSICLLLISSLYIASKSAIIQGYNIDQLVDSYMFEDTETFREASFPAAHTFFLKWPLFVFSSVAGNDAGVFSFLTILLYIFTLLAMVTLILYLSRRQTLVAALVISILTSLLLLIPVDAAPGVQAPVNMAMLTTRNIEYLIFFLFILLLSKSTKLLSWYFVLTVSTLTLLGLTDKLFVLFALGASVLHIPFQILVLKKKYVPNLTLPLVASACSYVLIILGSLVINTLEITTIYQPSRSAPFNTVSSVWHALTSFSWGIQAIFINYGADVFNKPLSIRLLPSIINCLLLLFAVFASYVLYVKKPLKGNLDESSRWKLGYWLFITSLAALLVYTLSNHNLEADLRYMTIALFAGIIAITIYLLESRSKYKNAYAVYAILLLTMCMPFSSLIARDNLNTSLNATKARFEDRIAKVSNIIDTKNIDLLVAEYWVTSPVKFRTNKDLQIAPLLEEGCLEPVHYLTSRHWYEPDPKTDSSALIVVRDENNHTYNHGCSPESLTKKLGIPYREIPLSDDGRETLRIYNYDIRHKLYRDR